MGTNIRNRLADVVILLEMEMRRIGLWEETAPPAEALSSPEPFCYDTLAFHQWMQWVLVPRTGELIGSNRPLPGVSDIAPLAEYRFQRLPQETGRLLELIRQYDRLLARPGK